MPASFAEPVADAPPRNLFDRFAPPWLKPYGRLARWDRPIGWQLLMWPCWWAAALAAVGAGRGHPDLSHLALFLVGAVAMRGAGCTYNDIVDRRLDAQVARTRSRPLPSGAATVRGAALFLVAQALVGLLVLIQFNAVTIGLGLASLAVVAAYPFAKRVTDWPQVVLGLAFSWGALVGWTALTGALAPPAVALYAAAVLWTVAYDTIYALQDREDDALIGVRSTARLFGSSARLAVAILYVAAFAVLAMAAVAAGGGLPGLAGIGFAAGIAVWIVLTLRTDRPDNCLARFKANNLVGWAVFIGFAADAAWQGWRV